MSGQAILFYGLLAPGAAKASSEQAGYPASNVLLGKVQRPWKALNATSLGSYVQIDLGAVYYVRLLAINAANMVTVDSVMADTMDPPLSLRGPLTLYQDKQGRSKGSVFISAAVRYIRLANFTGTPTDGDSVWSIGSIFLFSSYAQLARDPLFGESSNDLNTPQSRVDLDNGVSVVDDTGPSFMTPTLQFSGGATDDHEKLVRLTRAGLCWLNLNDGNGGDQWPVRHVDPKITRKFTGFNRETVQVSLKEQV